MGLETAFWVMLLLFLVISNVSAYRLGYSRGLLKGITVCEEFRLRENVQIKVNDLIWNGDPDVKDELFAGLLRELD